MTGTRSIELHFQEDFAGEPVEVRINSREAAAFTATTRYQIGLAHIEKLSIDANDKVTVLVGSQSLAVPLAADVDTYVVRLTAGVLSIDPAKDPPTYV